MNDKYESALSNRYASDEMQYIFSDKHKYTTWRRLWYALALAESRLGGIVSVSQLREMEANINNIDMDRAREIEKETHHDVAAHLQLFCECCPEAKPIIHLGATSCYITDNTDVILMREALSLVAAKLVTVIDGLKSRVCEGLYTDTMAYTHMQPALVTTQGKRFSLYMQDFMMDLYNVITQSNNMRSLGCRGAVGTSDSFMCMLDEDPHSVRQLESDIVEFMSMPQPFDVSGQTYTRKQDFFIMQALSGVAQSASKFATDVRLLCGLGEMREPFGENQVGSSAMPFKHNPIISEKICGLSRKVISDLQNFAITASSQWLERSLDDSSNRRLVIPEVFLTIDHILDSCAKVVGGAEYNEAVVKIKLESNAPHTEQDRLMVDSVKHGLDRQELHKQLRTTDVVPTGTSKHGDTTQIYYLFDRWDYERREACKSIVQVLSAMQEEKEDVTSSQ